MAIQEKNLVNLRALAGETPLSGVRDFQRNFLYTINSVIFQEGVLYRALQTFKSGELFNPVDWEKITMRITEFDGIMNYVTPDPAGIEQWASLDALRLGDWFHGGQSYTPSQGDFAVFINTDDTVWRAVFNGGLWSPEFKINDTPFTTPELEALHSGITAALIEKFFTFIIDPDNPADPPVGTVVNTFVDMKIVSDNNPGNCQRISAINYATYLNNFKTLNIFRDYGSSYPQRPVIYTTLNNLTLFYNSSNFVRETVAGLWQPISGPIVKIYTYSVFHNLHITTTDMLYRRVS